MAEMLASDALMEIFIKEGVEYIFGLPGSSEIPFMDALTRKPELKYILGLHEDVSVAMAEAYSRTTGKVGVVNLHTAPGFTAALPTIKNAKSGGVPLLVTVGQQNADKILEEPPLTNDVFSIAAEFGKWAAEVTYPGSLGVVMRRAFKVAMTPPTGPVFISLPQDVLKQMTDIGNYEPTRQEIYNQRPEKELMEMVADWLAVAKKPTITVGKGVAQYGALDEVVRLAELVGAAVFQGWQTDVCFPMSHDLFLGDTDRAISSASDVMLGVGTVVRTRPGAKAVQIDDNPWNLEKNAPIDTVLFGGVKGTVLELIEMVEQRMTDAARDEAKARIAEMAKLKAQKKASAIEGAKKEWDAVPISFSRLIQEVAAVMPDNAVLVEDCWSNSRELMPFIERNESGTWLRTRGGAIGSGIGMAVGAQLGQPDRKVVAVVGDGSTIWGCQAFWTAAHYKLPITYVVCSNMSYRIVKRLTLRQVGRDNIDKAIGLDFTDPRIDFCKLAESMGCISYRAEKPDELKGALEKAIASDGPSLVEIYIDGSL